MVVNPNGGKTRPTLDGIWSVKSRPTLDGIWSVKSRPTLDGIWSVKSAKTPIAEVLPVQPEHQELVEIPQENAPVDQQHTAEERRYPERIELVNKRDKCM